MKQVPCPTCERGTAVVLDRNLILLCNPCGGMTHRYDHPDIVPPKGRR